MDVIGAGVVAGGGGGDGGDGVTMELSHLSLVVTCASSLEV